MRVLWVLSSPPEIPYHLTYAGGCSLPQLTSMIEADWPAGLAVRDEAASRDHLASRDTGGMTLNGFCAKASL